MKRTRPRLASLTSRLVVTAVLLVAVVTLLVGGATALAMRSYLTSQLDQDVSSALNRAEKGPMGPDSPFSTDGPLTLGFHDSDGDVRGQGVGTLTAYFYADLSPSQMGTVIQDAGGTASQVGLGDDVLTELAAVRDDGHTHSVDLPGLGEYRVARSGSVLAGLPQDEVSSAVSNLLVVEGLLVALGILVAGVVGLTVVRRQLRPLREVAQTAHTVAGTPLDSGEIGVIGRVPAHLTDEATEVGQVGSALNTLLEHVETSLDARHRSEQRVRQFVADASHELRTPLTTIAGYTELARRRPDDRAAAATALAKVQEESKRMTSLVEDLLLLARLDSGRPLEQRPVDVTHLLLEAVSDARVLAPDHRWRLDLPEEAVEVTGDEDRLHQVVTNLLTNARKYTPAGTTVTVSAYDGHAPGDEGPTATGPAGFRVHDDGPGFPPDLVDHAFERFARGDVARHREGGVGLGLALVDAIVTAHGGEVALTSEPGDTLVDVRLGPERIV